MSIAVTTDGKLYAWGRNADGQLGDGTITDKSTPVQIGSLTNWKQVSTGGRHCAGIKTDGTLWTWGYNSFYGQLGDGTTVTKSSPVQIGSLTDWKQVVCGYNSTLCIKTDGTLWAWGANWSGHLGLSGNRSSPVQVGSLTNWKQISIRGGDVFGTASTLAITYREI